MSRILLDFSSAITGGQVSRTKGILSALQLCGNQYGSLLVLRRDDRQHVGNTVETIGGTITLSFKSARGWRRILQRLHLEYILVYKLCLTYDVHTYISFGHSLPRLPKSVNSVIGISNIAPFLDYRKIQSNSPLDALRLLVLRFNILRSIHSASKLIFISQFCADLILELVKKKLDYIVLPSPIYIEEKIDLGESLYDESFVFFYPSHFYSYKNHIRLLHAFKRLIDSGSEAKILLAGQPYNRHYYRKVLATCHDLGLSDLVDILHDVDHQKCLMLMRKTSCVIYPSLAENFPTTYLESLYYAHRVCCSYSRPFTDFYHPDASYFDP
jgi:glycosyltransferase involved in cell wall biosynthesis